MSSHKPSQDSSSSGERMSQMWFALFGMDGTNGLRGTQRIHGKRLDRIEKWRNEVETLVKLSRWMALALAGLMSFLMSDKFAEIVHFFVKPS